MTERLQLFAAGRVTSFATCDILFDSFWLGIQGSGLEAAAMGLPVVAGDADVAALYKQHVGEVPYTVALDELQLQRQLERLAVDAEYRASEAARAHAYVLAVHDYAAVGARYEAMLAAALKRPEILTPKGEPVIRGSGQLIDGLDDAIVGLSAGESKVF